MFGNVNPCLKRGPGREHERPWINKTEACFLLFVVLCDYNVAK